MLINQWINGYKDGLIVQHKQIKQYEYQHLNKHYSGKRIEHTMLGPVNTMKLLSSEAYCNKKHNYRYTLYNTN